MTSSCTPFLYRRNRFRTRKPLLLCWYIKRNRIVVKNIYFNSWLMFNLLSIIYECFSFRVFWFVCLRTSGHSDPLLPYSAILGFPPLPFKLLEVLALVVGLVDLFHPIGFLMKGTMVFLEGLLCNYKQFPQESSTCLLV